MTASKVISAAHPRLPTRPPSSALRAPAAAQVGPASAKRCLFGSPDPKELQKVCERVFERENQRMITNYGFDTKTEKFVTSSKVESGKSSGSSSKSAPTDAKSTKSASVMHAKTKPLAVLSPKKPYERLKASSRQSTMTDYYTTTKAASAAGSKDAASKKTSSKESSKNSKTRSDAKAAAEST